MNWSISRALMGRLQGEAVAGGSREICGLLVGREGRIVGAIPCANQALDPEHAFLLDPAEHLRVSRQARAAGLALIGCYHSHPGGDCRPSAGDAHGAIEDGLHWLILASEGRALWRSKAGGPVCGAFQPVPLEIA